MLDNTVWSGKRIDSDQQRSVVLASFFFFISSSGLKDQLLSFFLFFFFPAVVKCSVSFFCVRKAVEVNEISQRAVFAEKRSK